MGLIEKYFKEIICSCLLENQRKAFKIDVTAKKLKKNNPYIIIMSEDKKKEVHPIVMKALEIAYKEGNTINFDDYALEELQEMLKKYYGKAELLKAVIDLINLAGLLDEQGSHSASIKLITVISTTTDALKDLYKMK